MPRTWKVVSGQIEISRTPSSVEELTTLLKRRHARIGLTKRRGEHRAGSVVLVTPELVEVPSS